MGDGVVYERCEKFKDSKVDVHDGGGEIPRWISGSRQSTLSKRKI